MSEHSPRHNVLLDDPQIHLIDSAMSFKREHSTTPEDTRLNNLQNSLSTFTWRNPYTVDQLMARALGSLSDSYRSIGENLYTTIRGEVTVDRATKAQVDWYEYAKGRREELDARRDALVEKLPIDANGAAVVFNAEDVRFVASAVLSKVFSNRNFDLIPGVESTVDLT